MVTQVTFRGWRRPAVGALVDDVQGGRSLVQSTLRLTGFDSDDDVTGTETARLTVLLAGPGDVEGLHRGAITARFPSPGAVDAEETMCPYVEFADPSLPWRYTPRRTPAPDERRLRPWLALLVGTDEEIEIAGGTATVAASVLRAHPLRESPTWAHVQEAGDRVLARVLCRRSLEPRTGYVAVLVPTFLVVDGVLQNAWDPSPAGPVSLASYSSWRFRTGPGGDFRTLAVRLGPLSAKREPGGPPLDLGRAPVTYRRGAVSAQLSVGGALTAVGGAPDDPLPAEVFTDLQQLRSSEQDDEGRPIVGLPVYGAAWHDDADRTGWGAALNDDPRHRGVAGLGLQLAVDRQEELAEQAAEQAGALDPAAERVRHLNLGLAASEALWRRRLPADPQRRVWLLGPALRRVVTATGPVDALATADDRPLARGWFSSAMRRVLRPGPARAAIADPAALDPALLNPSANRPPAPVPIVEAGLPPLNQLGATDFDTRRLHAIADETPQPLADPRLARMFESLDMGRFPTHHVPLRALQALTVGQMESADPDRPRMPWVPLTLLLTAIGEGEDDPVFDEATAVPLLRALDDQGFAASIDEPQVLKGLLEDLGDTPDPPPPSRPLALDRLAAELAEGFDPSKPSAVARRRVLATIAGLTPSRPPDQPPEPPEPCPGLDVPVWRMLSDMSADWLLPGVGQLAEDSVVAMGSNPVFVDAFLAGLNTRLVEELRWRNFRVAAGCTPVRTFWFRSEATSGERADDIVGVRNWTTDSSLGDPQHRPDSSAGRDLVLVIRGQLFQRYPEALLYLVSARHGGQTDFSVAPDPNARRILPTFQGRVGADVTFFGFVGTPPGEVVELWVAVEEPPSGFRFRNDDQVPEAATAVDGAEFADRAFDDPVRVLIQGDHLVPGEAP